MDPTPFLMRKRWILHTDGNVQYMAELIKFAPGRVRFGVAKFWKAPSGHFKPSHHSCFMPMAAWLELTKSADEITNEFSLEMREGIQ